MANHHSQKKAQQQRDDLTGEHAIGNAGQIVLGCLFAAMWVIAIGFLHYISRYEERLLLVRFGEEYEQYIQEVPMWIPRLRKR